MTPAGPGRTRPPALQWMRIDDAALEKDRVDEEVAFEEDDQTLVHRVQKGDGEAYDRLMLRYEDAIGRQMRRFSQDRNIVEELTQTVFVKAYFSLGAYVPQSPFAHWLRTIASRVGYDHWREKKKAGKLVPLERLGERCAAAGPEETPVDERFRMVVEVMDLLKPEDRIILYRLHIDGLTLAEAAEEMGWGVAMTKMRAFRAKRRLRAILQRME